MKPLVFSLEPLVLSYEYSIYIWYVSWLSLLSSGFGYYKQVPCSLYIIPFSVFVTSILYWHKPDYSWRRYLDIGVVISGLLYKLYYAFSTTIYAEYYAIMVLAISCYGISTYCANKHAGLSTFWHCMLHIIANVGNIVLYSNLTF